MLEQYVQLLGKELQTPFSRDEQKQVHLKLGNVAVMMKELDPGIYFSADLTAPPMQKKEEAFIYFMKANFLGQGTGDAVLGLKEDESCLTLSLALPYDMNYNAFKEALEGFSNFAAFWKKGF